MKSGNRRKRRKEYLLDVKVQRQGRLRRRLRVGVGLLGTLIVLTLSCYGLYRLAKFTVHRLVYENPRFAITQIIVDNDGVLTPPQVAQLAGVQIGDNLLGLDLDQVRRNLEMIPLVRRVEVRRMLPNQLRIRLEERTAVARLHVSSRQLNDAVFWVDRSGVVIKPLKLTDGTVIQPQMPRPAPLLTGVSLADVRVGRQVESEQIYRALELLDQLEQAAVGTMVDVEKIDLSRPRQLALTTRQGAVVKLDVEDFSQQLRRLGVIFQWAQQRQKAVQTVDLTVPRGVPVTFLN